MKLTQLATNRLARSAATWIRKITHACDSPRPRQSSGRVAQRTFKFWHCCECDAVGPKVDLVEAMEGADPREDEALYEWCEELDLGCEWNDGAVNGVNGSLRIEGGA